jgi:serine/threonine-protein kinase
MKEPAAQFAEPVLRDLSLRAAMADAAPPAALVRALAARYRVEREIGRGGMAAVYLAHDLRFDRAVAIKVLRPELARDCDVWHFQREVGRTARLNHPHIVPVFDSGDPGGRVVLRDAVHGGGTLRRRLAHQRRLPIAEAIAIARTIAQALDCAHRHGLVHRDVKPENILFADREPSLADFGIARALDRIPTETWSSIGIVRGTAEYMSPEQVRPEHQLDGRSDVYALACVAVRMPAATPVHGRDPLAVMRRQLQDAPPWVARRPGSDRAGDPPGLAARATALTPRPRSPRPWPVNRASSPIQPTFT